MRDERENGRVAPMVQPVALMGDPTGVIARGWKADLRIRWQEIQLNARLHPRRDRRSRLIRRLVAAGRRGLLA